MSENYKKYNKLNQKFINILPHNHPLSEGFILFLSSSSFLNENKKSNVVNQMDMDIDFDIIILKMESLKRKINTHLYINISEHSYMHACIHVCANE